MTFPDLEQWKLLMPASAWRDVEASLGNFTRSSADPYPPPSSRSRRCGDLPEDLLAGLHRHKSSGHGRRLIWQRCFVHVPPRPWRSIQRCLCGGNSERCNVRPQWAKHGEAEECRCNFPLKTYSFEPDLDPTRQAESRFGNRGSISWVAQPFEGILHWHSQRRSKARRQPGGMAQPPTRLLTSLALPGLLPEHADRFCRRTTSFPTIGSLPAQAALTFGSAWFQAAALKCHCCFSFMCFY